MNRKIVFCILSIICVAVLSITGCSLGKTVTQTVASTTVTQWTSAVTQTATVVNSVTTTLPGAVTTITSPPITTTVVETTTITAPPVTTTTTSTVTSPPVTTTVTVIPTTTAPVLTAAEAIDMSVLWLATMSGIQPVTSLYPAPNTATQKTYYVALTYKNNSAQQFTNVKFSFALLLETITFDVATPTNAELSIYTVPVNALSIWVRSAPAVNVWSFQPFQGFTIAAHGEGTLLLEVTIDSNTAGNAILALPSVL